MKKRGWPLSLLDEIVGAVSAESKATPGQRLGAIARKDYTVDLPLTHKTVKSPSWWGPLYDQHYYKRLKEAVTRAECELPQGLPRPKKDAA